MRKLFFIILALSSFQGLVAQEGLITLPTLSSSCRELSKKKEYKANIRQKAIYLSIRVEKIKKMVPVNKIVLTRKLGKIHSKLSRKIMILNYQIKNIEESIIRKGCPGIHHLGQ